MPDAPEGLTVAETGLSDDQKSFINANFRGAMSEDYSTHASMADYQDLDGWGKSHINQQKLIGGDKLPMPQDSWGKEEWADFNRKIGMPVDAKGYELEAHKTATEEDMEWFAELAHGKLNLSKKQANDLWNEINGRTGGAMEANQTKNQAALDEGMKTLREEWGTNFQPMVDATNKGLQRMDEDGRFRKFMKESGLNKHPEMLRFAHKVAASFNEDRVPGDTQSPMPMNKEQAKAQLNKIFSEAQKDPKHPLMNKKDPSHEDIVKKITKLSEAAGGA